MKISKILEQERHANSANAIDDAFGDRYLYKNNFIFRRIRDKGLVTGLKYKSELVSSYVLLPLICLQKIIDSNVIPYFNNGSILYDLEIAFPNTIVWTEVKVSLKKNYHFHESCHVVSRSLFVSVFQNQILSSNQQLLQIFIEESFSNTCELLAIKDVADVTHKIFFEHNSYIFVPELKTLILELEKFIGFAKLFQFILLNYLNSNFMHFVQSEKFFEKSIQFVDIDKQIIKIYSKKLKSLARICYELNPEFKQQTSSLYLKMKKISNSIDQLNQINFFQDLETNQLFKKWLVELSAIFN